MRRSTSSRYASAGHYFLGGHEFAEQERQMTFDFTKQLSSKLKQLPKLSLHETGQVHVQVGRDRAGPLRIPPLSELRGQHVASISADKFETLAPFEGTPRSSGAEQDFVFVVEAGLDSGRIALYVNGEEPSFADDCPVRITLTRPTLASPLHLGLRPWGQLPLGEIADKGGVTVTSGWNPLTALGESSMQFLYIRGE